MPKLKDKSRFRPSRPLVRCALCGGVYASVVPKGGTGETRFPWKHNRPDGLVCDGTYQDVPLLETEDQL